MPAKPVPYETLVRLAAANERLEANVLALEKNVICRADWIGEQLGLVGLSCDYWEVVAEEFREAVDRRAA
jgi:hypothetical protein